MEYAKTFIQLPDIPEQVESASHAYEIAFSLARAGDVLGWRKLVKNIRPNVFKSLVEWRQDELNDQKPKNTEQSIEVVDKAVEIISPLMVVALVGIESGREEFRNQKSLLDDLLNITGWNSDENRDWIRLPYALGYVYHSLHGCTGLSTNQIDIALGLARVKIPDRYNRKKVLQVWEMSELVGWPKSLGPNCVESWRYLANAYEREGWEWLSDLFEGKREYRALLVAYYMALNIHELGVLIALNQQDNLSTSYSTSFPFHFNVPLTFMSENQEVYQRAIHLLCRNPDSVTGLWTILNVTHEQMKNSWEHWVRNFEGWLRNVYERYPDVNMQTVHENVDYYQHFFEMLKT